MRKIEVSLMALLAACKDPVTKDSIIDECNPIPREPCETGGEEIADSSTGGDETGGEPDMLGPGECVFNVNENKVGLQYNCIGELHTSIDLTITGLFSTCEDLFKDDAWCSDDYYFDNAPNVVACCGEYDLELEPIYQEFCTYDLYQQVCLSIAEQLEHLVQAGSFGAYTKKAAKLQQYVAENHGACFQAFLHNNTAALPNVQTKWALQKNFGLLADIVFHIDADTRVDGVNAPDFDEDWPTCSGGGYNNDTVFSDAGRLPIGEIVVGVDLLEPVHAELSGPVMFGGEVSAAMDFGTNCSALGCPEAIFSHDLDGDRFGLEGFVLIGDALEISIGDFTLHADRVQVKLYAQSVGRRIFDPTMEVPLGYEIAPGDASFLVAGVSGNTANRFMATNATPIQIIITTPGEWVIGGFLLEYEDGNDNRWTLMVEESRWQ